MRKIIPYNPKLKELAKKLRNDSTKSEIVLWNELRNKTFFDQKFIRQKPLDEFIVDFYCYDLELVIELDGITHQFETVLEKDKIKEKRLNELGLTVLRFQDDEVLNDMTNVLRTIEKFILDKNDDNIIRTTQPQALSRGEFKTILKKYWNYDEFRPLQEDIIQSIYDGKDTLALLPTGGGKSICFQVPALAMEGVCIVVSPLIALMKDQVQNLKSKGINATALYSGMRKEAIDIALDNCIYGETKFLYLSPERLNSDLFIARFKSMKVSFIAVDEAHCISQWGYDFRPAYLKISDLREHKPDIKILALTATATPKVVIDIQAKLQFEKQNVLQKSFQRTNLSYSVLYEQAKMTKMLDILQKVKGSAIVYVQNRKQTKEISDYLNENRISSTYYHAGLSIEQRDERQQKWIQDELKVIVATNAFGMGIDKPNVRVVIHITLPNSLEAYFQEAGRAGRDGKKAYAVLLTNDTDKLKIQSTLKKTMPSIEEIKSAYVALGNFFQLAIGAGYEQTFAFDIVDFCGRNKLGVLKTYHALKFLEYHEYLSLSEAFNQEAKVYIRTGKHQFENFVKKQQKFKDLLQLMLRSYGGMFDGYTKVNEKFLAQKLNIEIAELQKHLKQLEMQQVLYYEARNSNPYIFFTEARMEENNLNLDAKYIQERIQTFEEKHLQMLAYSQEKKVCRSMQLLKYFGESLEFPCGICDVCLGRNIKDFELDEVEKYAFRIKKSLIKKPHSALDLMMALKENNKTKFAEILKHLIEVGFVSKNKNDLLSWRSKK
ncbi:MAG: RecQ family ATP-dependent DNA helicase [Chitinophagales bacterium]